MLIVGLSYYINKTSVLNQRYLQPQ